jgi:hypothetical protein
MSVASGDIRGIIDRLVVERQSLRADGGDLAALHANRLALAYWQLQLTRALAAEAPTGNAAAAG